MSRSARSLFLIFLTLLAPVFSLAAAAQETAPNTLGFEFQEYRLRNGLRVILSVDDRLPLVTVVVAYGAGTVRERTGQAGLAYLLENLMFRGSENVGPLQHVGFVQKVGGDLNATTTPDRAQFFQTLPSNSLALALWLESDRMKSLAITPASIEITRTDLIREHQERLDSDPYLSSFAWFDALLYPDYIFGHPLIEAGESMRNIADKEIMEFHQTYYVPNNAILCIVGNIDIAGTRELVGRYFDTIPPGYDIPPPPVPVFRQDGPVVRNLSDIVTSSYGFHMGFRFYPLQTGDAYSLKILEYVLLKGETSRLRNRLLHRDLTAQYLSGGLENRGGVLGLKIFCLNNNADMVERAERTILSEIDRLRTNPASPDEMAKVRKLFKMDYLRSQSTNLGRALFLVDAAFSGKPMDALGGELDKYLKVTPPTLTNLLGRYFTLQNRVILELGKK
jgi:zinc protease